MVDQIAVNHGLSIGVAIDRRAEDLGGMQGRRGGEGDFRGIEIVEDAAVFGEVILQRAKFEVFLAQLGVERVAAMGFVDDDAIIGSGRRAFIDPLGAR